MAKKKKKKKKEKNPPPPAFKSQQPHQVITPLKQNKTKQIKTKQTIRNTHNHTTAAQKQQTPTQGGGANLRAQWWASSGMIEVRSSA